MGLEAYRIELEPAHLATRNNIFKEFTKLGFQVSGESFSNIYLEKAYNWGYAEVALQNSELHRIALNKYKTEQNQEEYVVTKPADDKEKITIQIAKPNHENVIDSLVADLRAFNNEIPITVTNLQTKKTVNLNQYGDLKDHFRTEHDEFSRWYPKPMYPIRCREVFK